MSIDFFKSTLESDAVFVNVPDVGSLFRIKCFQYNVKLCVSRNEEDERKWRKNKTQFQNAKLML